MMVTDSTTYNSTFTINTKPTLLQLAAVVKNSFNKIPIGIFLYYIYIRYDCKHIKKR